MKRTGRNCSQDVKENYYKKNLKKRKKNSENYDSLDSRVITLLSL